MGDLSPLGPSSDPATISVSSSTTAMNSSEDVKVDEMADERQTARSAVLDKYRYLYIPGTAHPPLSLHPGDSSASPTIIILSLAEISRIPGAVADDDIYDDMLKRLESYIQSDSNEGILAIDSSLAANTEKPGAEGSQAKSRGYVLVVLAAEGVGGRDGLDQGRPVRLREDLRADQACKGTSLKRERASMTWWIKKWWSLPRAYVLYSFLLACTAVT